MSFNAERIVRSVPTSADPGQPGSASDQEQPTPADLFDQQLLTLEQLAKLPPAEWLIENVIVRDSLVLVVGQPKSGKTFLVLDWALRVAYGPHTFVDYHVDRGRVLYVAGEGYRGLAKRTVAWRTHAYGATTEPADPQFALYPRAVNLLDHADVNAVVAWCEQTRPALVILDTLARSMVGGDENSAKDMSTAVAAADRIKDASGGTVILVHHTGKNGEEYRGSSALRGAIDTHVKVEKDAKTDTVTVTCEDQKDAAPFDPIRMRMHVVELDDRGEASCVLRPIGRTEAQEEAAGWEDRIIDAIRVLGGSATRAAIRDELGVPPGADSTEKRAFNRAAQQLIKAGRVGTAGQNTQQRLTLPTGDSKPAWTVERTSEAVLRVITKAQPNPVSEATLRQAVGARTEDGPPLDVYLEAVGTLTSDGRIVRDKKDRFTLPDTPAEGDAQP